MKSAHRVAGPHSVPVNSQAVLRLARNLLIAFAVFVHSTPAESSDFPRITLQWRYCHSTCPVERGAATAFPGNRLLICFAGGFVVDFVKEGEHP